MRPQHPPTESSYEAFTTLLVRIDRLRAVTSDGVVDIMKRWSPCWHDQHLVAVAFMDMGAADLAAELERWGLTLRDTSSGTTMWQDICVVDYYEGPTNPCPWLEYDPVEHIAWLKGTPQGRVAGPEHRHEDAPMRVAPDKLQQWTQHQYPAPARPQEPRRRQHLHRDQPVKPRLPRLVNSPHAAAPGQR